MGVYRDNNWKPKTRDIEITSGTFGWDGYGTALKPAYEPIIIAVKPCEGTYAENALKYGVSGLNIDGSRIKPSNGDDTKRSIDGHKTSYIGGHLEKNYGIENQANRDSGRFPANIILDEESGAVMDEQCPETSRGYSKATNGSKSGKGSIFNQGGVNANRYDMGGLGASRFFYCAKASKSERNAGCENLEKGDPPASARSNPAKGRKSALGSPRPNFHPTVKPLKLMEYLCNLTKTPTGGTVLDPFMGSGSTGIACVNTNRDFIGIEKEVEYLEIAEKRIKHAEIKMFENQTKED